MKSARRTSPLGLAITPVLSILARIKAARLRREHLRRLEDDRRVREMLIGRPFAKRRKAAIKGLAR